MGCRCERVPDTWIARCVDCAWTFKITDLMPAFDGSLVSRTCMRDKPQGATVRMPEELLMVAAVNSAPQ